MTDSPVTRMPDLDQEDLQFILQRAPVLTIEVLVTNPEGTKIVLTRKADSPMKGLWQLPGGFLGWGESFREAIIRVMKSTTGLSPGNVREIGVVDYYDSEASAHIISLWFHSTVVLGSTPGDEPVDAFGTLPKDMIPHQRTLLEKMGLFVGKSG